jgi:hypothetical protein
VSTLSQTATRYDIPLMRAMIDFDRLCRRKRKKLLTDDRLNALRDLIVPMEHLFSPCTRLHAILDSQGLLEDVRRRHPESLQELNLNISTEELLSTEKAFTYADLHTMLGNEDTVAWLTPHAAVVREYGRAMRFWKQLAASYRFCFTVDAKVIIAYARTIEHLLEICDVVVRLLAVSVVQSVCLFNWEGFEGTCINAPTLAHLME